jgi:hypothetical protein
VWAVEAPGDAVRVTTIDEASRIDETGRRVCLPDYDAATRVLISLGASPEWAEYCAGKARRQPQRQDSYLPPP